jgi:hypothetical protein
MNPKNQIDIRILAKDMRISKDELISKLISEFITNRE